MKSFQFYLFWRVPQEWPWPQVVVTTTPGCHLWPRIRPENGIAGGTEHVCACYVEAPFGPVLELDDDEFFVFTDSDDGRFDLFFGTGRCRVDHQQEKQDKHNNPQEE